jgi:transposase
MPPSRRIKLTEEEDDRLRQIEQDPYLRSKVRLRAQVLRLSNRGSNIRAIASYTARSRASVARDLDRWTERGLEGLADGAAPGNPPRITEEARRCMEQRLAEERNLERDPTGRGARGAILGLVVTPEAVRQHLLSMGYSWERTRYVPNKAPDPDAEREAREKLEALKRGRRGERSS